MTRQIRLEHPSPRPLAVVRRRGTSADLPRIIPEACGLVWTAVRTLNISGPGRHVAVFWDDEINLSIGVEVAAPFTPAGDLECSFTPAGPVATAAHIGPYQTLAQTHQAVRDWCDRHGYGLAGPRWEIYGHWDEEWNRDPGKIRTDVFYLLTAGADASGSGGTARG